MYVAVKGGEAAIAASLDLIAYHRRGDLRVSEIEVAQIREQMKICVARVMNEGSLYDEDLAALALKQAQGDLIEAAFLMRAFRTTLKRLGSSLPLDITKMAVQRRISAAFKDLPGGQILGPTYDYTHRLFEFSLAAQGSEPEVQESSSVLDASMPRVADLLADEGLIEPELPADHDPSPMDITRDPVEFPADRATRLQILSRGDEGFLLGLAYSTQRGFGGNHPFAGEIRMGEVNVQFYSEELGMVLDIGDITVTECQMINQFKGSAKIPPQFTRGYGFTFGHCERKAMSMALVDRALKSKDLDEGQTYPAQQEEFVLYHCDSIEASGFVEHLKLPHYVDFQGELELIRKIRAEQALSKANAAQQSLDAPQ